MIYDQGLREPMPAPLRRYVQHFETAIEDAVAEFAASLPRGRDALTPAPVKGTTNIISPGSATAAWIWASATPPGIIRDST